MMPAQVVVLGAGRMGKLIQNLLKEQGYGVAAMIDSTTSNEDLSDLSAHLVIDFSLPHALEKWLPFFVAKKWNLITGTTGLTDHQQTQLLEASNSISIIQDSNFSIGIHLMKKALKSVLPHLTDSVDVEVSESHHNQKIDSPSGTAISLINTLTQEGSPLKNYKVIEGASEGKKGNSINVHALRGGNITGDHKVDFILNDEILTIEHRALNRKIFAQGAISCIPFLQQSKNGLYSLKDVF